MISHERIYQHVWKDKKDGGTLYLHLRHSGKKYNRRKGRNSGRGLIPNRVDIDQRPPIVAAKSRIGDWEADTIIGANHKGVVMSHVERTSKYTKLAKLPDKNADFVVQACARVLLPLADRIETITYDNGKEFASHAQIATSLGALSYFAKPYHSWERGLNEHTNGLFRQYFPKGSDLSILSDADVQRVEDKLNSRPRKILGGITGNFFQRTGNFSRPRSDCRTCQSSGRQGGWSFRERQDPRPTNLTAIAVAEPIYGTADRNAAARLSGSRSHLRRAASASDPCSYSCYYNEKRTHLSLNKDVPLGRAVQRHGAVVAVPILSRLHHCYARI